ncbi:DMT family transporter [bacterium]|nr:DMT family transporter [bacterium]
MSWIVFTIFAALMQSVRTAGQKAMGSTFSPMANTCVRFLFGLPVAVLYFLFLRLVNSSTFLNFSSEFFIYALLAGISQVFGTVLQVRLLGLRNFATGTVFVKSEVMLTAFIGFTFFDDVLGLRSWMGILLCTMGIVFLTLGSHKVFQWKNLSGPSVLMGVGAGLGFSLAALFIRRASLSLNAGFMLSAATCLVGVVALQTIIMVLYLILFEPNQWKIIFSKSRQSVFIGITSIFGSIGWFTAMTLIQASFVRALGQVEVIFALIITYGFFKEKPRQFEWIGILGVTLGIFLTIL